jgi:hypothetical protein
MADSSRSINVCVFVQRTRETFRMYASALHTYRVLFSTNKASASSLCRRPLGTSDLDWLHARGVCASPLWNERPGSYIEGRSTWGSRRLIANA